MDDDKELLLDTSTWTLFKEKLWPYIKKYRVQFYSSIALVLCSTFLAIALPWLLGVIIDRVLDHKRENLILLASMSYLGISFLRALTLYITTVSLTTVGQYVLHDIRHDLLKTYQFYPISEFNKTPTGRMVTRLVNDTYSLQDLFTSGIAVALADALIIVGIMIWMVIANFKMGLVSSAIFPVLVLALRYFSKKIRATYRESRAALSRLNAFLSENIHGMWLIQVFNRTTYFKKIFDRASKYYTQKQLNTVHQYALFQPTITILSSLSMSLLILYTGITLTRGDHSLATQTVTIGLIVAFISYLQAVYTPIRDLTEKFNLFVSAMASGEKVFEFMERPTEQGIETYNEKDNKLNDAPNFISFEDISFRYDDSRLILKNISFKAKKNEKIGIVGHTGAGKTTFVSLLLRFYETTSGRILFDDIDISTLNKHELRKFVGYIQQEPFLFSGTVEENIVLWNEQAKNFLAQSSELVQELMSHDRFHLKTRVHEKGANLSAGERQMIAFIRALAQNPKVLILDEATSHVDLLTERWIEAVSDRYFSNRTVFIIAHRLATLKRVDRILVFHHGELVEQGSHFELLAKNGIYSKLHAIQSKREEILRVE